MQARVGETPGVKLRRRLGRTEQRSRSTSRSKKEPAFVPFFCAYGFAPCRRISTHRRLASPDTFPELNPRFGEEAAGKCLAERLRSLVWAASVVQNQQASISYGNAGVELLEVFQERSITRRPKEATPESIRCLPHLQRYNCLNAQPSLRKDKS